MKAWPHVEVAGQRSPAWTDPWAFCDPWLLLAALALGRVLALALQVHEEGRDRAAHNPQPGAPAWAA